MSAGEKLRAVLDERDLGVRTFARMLSKDSGRAIDDERRGVQRRLTGQTFLEPARLQYARVLGLPPDYFKVSKPPRRTEVELLLAQARELLRRAEELEQRYDDLEEQQ